VLSYRDGAAVRRSLVAAGRRIAGDRAPRLLRVDATINGVVYEVLGTPGGRGAAERRGLGRVRSDQTEAASLQVFR
jgi:hypothetical protein